MSSPTVIVPTHSRPEQLKRLLASLAVQSAEHEAIVVDNASPGGVASEVCGGFPNVEAIRCERNLGYSRAVNLAAGRATGDAIVLVNDDCVCDPSFVERIVAALDPTRGVVMAAGVMRDGRDPSLIDTAGIELDATLLGFDYLNGEPMSVLDGEVEDPVGPSGAAAAFDRSAFLKVGGFDERLFAYWEDVDLALRLATGGGSCALAATARGTHEHSATLGPGSAGKNYLMGFGRGYVMRKWSVLAPRRLAAVLFRDGVLCAGQLVLDRNGSGIRGRVRGFRASDAREPYPAEAVRRSPRPTGVLGDLRRRAARRSRLRRAAGADPSEPASPPGGGTVAVFHLAETSGPSRSLEAELESLAASGPLDVVVPGPGRVARDFGRLGTVTTLEYEALTVPRGPVKMFRALRRLVREARAFRAHLRSVRPDLAVVVTATLPAQLIAARLERVPTVVYVGELVRGPDVRPGGLMKRAFGAALIALVGRLATAVIACSETVARQFGGRARTKVTTVYPPVPDPDGFGDRDGFRRRHGVGDDDVCVAAIGNITEGRGQDVLIRALPLIGDTDDSLRCVIVGLPLPRAQDVAYREELARVSEELGMGDRVVFAGFADEPADVFAAADVVVNPARSSESFGRVACEALVAGRPVVATRVGAVPEVLWDGETALLVPPDDPAALAAAVERIVRDPELGSRLAQRGREDVLRRFNARGSLERFRAVARAAAPDLVRNAR